MAGPLDEQHPHETQEQHESEDQEKSSYAGPYETGPLAEPIDEPIPRGTLILLGLFLLFLVFLWLLAYLAVWNRGVS